MKILLEKIMSNEYLTEQEARQFIYNIDQDDVNESLVAAILTGIQLRGTQLDELNGFRAALLELCTKVDLDAAQAIDVCGTGGDGKDTFNISTTTAFVLAAMGVKVIKHGNYGVSSICGSSNVLEEMGIKFNTQNEQLAENLERFNICFIHAPLFHPTLKKVAPIRKKLGIRTVFNSLGPLVNPAQPGYQLTGTFSLELARIYTHILQKDRTDFRVLFGMDGYDEITLTNATRVFGKESDQVLTADIFNVPKISPHQLASGATIRDASKIMLDILKGKGTPVQNAVIASNAATALQMYFPETSIQELFKESIEVIQSGNVFKHQNFKS